MSAPNFLTLAPQSAAVNDRGLTEAEEDALDAVAFAVAWREFERDGGEFFELNDVLSELSATPQPT